jgi:hypothetical protein
MAQNNQLYFLRTSHNGNKVLFLKNFFTQRGSSTLWQCKQTGGIPKRQCPSNMNIENGQITNPDAILQHNHPSPVYNLQIE